MLIIINGDGYKSDYINLNKRFLKSYTYAYLECCELSGLQGEQHQTISHACGSGNLIQRVDIIRLPEVILLLMH